MMNGEGTSESLLDDELLTWRVSDPKLLDISNEVSPISSRYSSCGESEFDRYCSANSVMGTPSMCSSVGTFHDFPDSDIGSVKSSRFGDVGSLENFSLAGKFENKNSLALGRLGEYSHRSSEKTEQRSVMKENEMTLYGEMDPSFSDLPDGGGVVLWKTELDSNKLQSTSTSKETNEDFSENAGVEEGSESRTDVDLVNNVFEGEQQLDEHSDDRSEEETSSRFERDDLSEVETSSRFERDDHSEGETSSRLEQDDRSEEETSSRFERDDRSEGETSSRLEHSESEGSMYGYGTDNEEKAGLPAGVCNDYSHDKKRNNENALLMTSSIAYGLDDWNDYMQETMENPEDLFVIHEVQGNNQNEILSEGYASKPTVACESIDVTQKQENVKDLPTSSKTRSISHIDLLKDEEIEKGKLVKDMFIIGKQADDFNQLKMEGALFMDVLHKKTENTNLNETTDNLTLGYVPSTLTQDTEDHVAEIGYVPSTLTQDTEDHVAEIPKDHKPYSLQSLPNSINLEKRQNATPTKAESYELNEFYDEVVYEMEEILLDSSESPAARFTRGGKHHHSHVSLPSRDGGSTASTSSIETFHSVVQNPYKIDGIEVIGATQKKGDVSLGERLVGVKEYTVYKLRVWSGTHQWEVERRYRDFFTLYRRLKTSFANKGWDLPSPWSMVDRESRKYFGNASPDVVSERSILIQECLQSILHSKFSSGLPNSMIWFLFPPKDGPDSPNFNTHISQSQLGSKPIYTLGQSISLIVEIRPHKSIRQMLEGQHYTCAGCHKYFDEGKTRLWEFVQTFGWGKPRLCEYTGQVFCSSCHINETAILPARVLHYWDFKEYPVSQLAKSYLDSIHDKPMLCVGAVNPFLFTKVGPLQHVINVRKRIGRMLPYVRCPFRRSIYKAVGSRRYILESSDFFALKDLVDLSKGVFAALPVMVETISKKIVNHITEECLICYDVGVPCGARQACDDPSSLIFPFQEGEVERCKSCELVYHKACFKKMATCPCGVDLGPRSMRNPNVSGNEVRASPNNLVRNPESRLSMGFLSGLLSKASPGKFWGPTDDDTVIPMGSLPSSSF